MKPIALALALALIVLAPSGGPPAGGRVDYQPAESEPQLVGQVHVDTPLKPADIDAADRVYSPHRTRWLRVDEPGGNLPYEDRVGRVHVAGGEGFGRTIVFSHFKSVRVRWVNEKLLYVQVWAGRVLATEHVFDLESSKPIYQEVSVHSTHPAPQQPSGSGGSRVITPVPQPSGE